MNNGSGVSNFSSVSNINNILNAHHQIERTDFQVNSIQNASNNDELMSNIDRVLSKVNRSNNLPTKTLEKVMSGKETEKYGS